MTGKSITTPGKAQHIRMFINEQYLSENIPPDTCLFTHNQHITLDFNHFKKLAYFL